MLELTENVEPTIFLTPVAHANHYTIKVVLTEMIPKLQAVIIHLMFVTCHRLLYLVAYNTTLMV
jgi:hypothetical protein